jgi:hypothetical protein
VSASVEEHEAGLAAFLLPDRRQRFRRALVNEKSRAKLLGELYHFERRLDPAFSERLKMSTKHDAFIAEVYELLVARGAPPRCVALRAVDSEGGEGVLAEVVPDIMWSGSGLVSCVPGALGLYVGEDGSNVFLLRRPAS